MAFSFLYLAVRALLGALVRSRRAWGAQTQSRRDLVLVKYSSEKVAPLDL